MSNAMWFSPTRRAPAALSAAEAPSAIRFPPAVTEPAAPAIEQPLIVILTPVEAMSGGSPETELPDGRRVRVTLPAGQRAGSKVRVDGHVFEIALKAEGDMIVRGDDLVDVWPIDLRHW